MSMLSALSSPSTYALLVLVVFYSASVRSLGHVGPSRYCVGNLGTESYQYHPNLSGQNMLYAILPQLNRLSIVLASQSARRKDTLNQIGLRFRIQTSEFEELLDKSQFESPAEYVKANAILKAAFVADNLRTHQASADLVIGSDTVVVIDDRILEKPKTEAQAIEMLHLLNDRTHNVVTAVSFITLNEKAFGFKDPILERSSPNVKPYVGSNLPEGFKARARCFCVSTKVSFASLSDEEIQAYVETKEPMDKAGAYGIQAKGGAFVVGIEGDYYNVLGFPLQQFCSNLHQLYSTGS